MKQKWKYLVPTSGWDTLPAGVERLKEGWPGAESNQCWDCGDKVSRHVIVLADHKILCPGDEWDLPE